MATAAMTFAGELSSRYLRLRTPLVRPVDTVLRALPAPRVDHRVFVDARSWRVVSLAEAAPSVARRAERGPAPLLMQIVERLRRDDGSTPRSSQPIAPMPRLGKRPQERTDVETRSVRGVTMVLARQALPAEPRAVKDVVTIADDWPSSAAPSKPATRHQSIAPAPVPIDVNHLTERVVAAIDRRMMAARERMGR